MTTRRWSSRRTAGWAALATLTAVLVAPATAAPVPDGAVHSEHYFPSGDGTSLHADVFRPAGRKDKVPVILLVSPYTSTCLLYTSPSPRDS